MKLSLLDMTIDILNDIDSDPVNSIDDTMESQQVAQIIKSSYFAMISNRNWPHTKKPIQFDSSLDPSLPTHTQLPENVKELIFINYNKSKDGETRKRFVPIKWKNPDEFLHILNGRNNDADNIDVIVDPSGVELLIQTDKHPDYYTSFDDDTIVFDSYDKEVDTTIQNTKMQAHGYVIPSWSMQDSFIPDLPVDAFTALLEEAKSRASLKLRQVSDQKAEQETQRQQRWLSRKDWRVHGGIQYPNYGRSSRK